MKKEEYTVTTGTTEDFFRQGRDIARKLDRGERVEPMRLITFEDPEDLLELLSSGRVELFRAVKNEPGSIADLARRLHRDRSAVKRDVDILTAAGIVLVEEKPFPGHGKMKFVKPLATNFNLMFQMG